MRVCQKFILIFHRYLPDGGKQDIKEETIRVAYHIGKDRTLRPAADLTAGFLVTAKEIFLNSGEADKRIK